MEKNMIMIHGMWMNGKIFHYWKQYFEAKGYNVYTPALKFHGECERRLNKKGIEKIGINTYVKDMIDRINNIKEPILFGYSMGGLIAQRLASIFKMKKIILLSSVPPAKTIGINFNMIAEVKDIISKPFWWRKGHKLNEESAKRLIFNNVSEDVFQEMYKYFYYESGKSFMEMMNPMNMDNNVESIGTDVLTVVGSEDVCLPPRVSKAIAKKYNADMYIFNGYGHYLFEQRSMNDILPIINQWIER